MERLCAPWSGLVEVAPQVDLWGIVSTLGGPAAAARAGPADWSAAGLPLRYLASLSAPPREGRWVHAGGPGWPAILDELPYGPVALAVEGDVRRLQGAGAAVVGARACTGYGAAQARAIGRAVAEAGGIVVSGLARGIDTAAHLAARGATVAVLGQGLGAAMARGQQEVRARIVAEGGCVVSEFPSAQHAAPWSFPVRNRIVAGLARVAVVVEAATRSGARNTANHALRYGREVFAVPGPLGASASEGCLDLLEDGATMVRSPATVLAALGLGSAPAREADPLLAALATGATVDELAMRTGRGAAAVTEALGRLLLAGRVARAPGARYVLT